MKILSLNTQLKLLKKCVDEDLDLVCELERLGYTYDSLRYRYLEHNKDSRQGFRTPEDYDYPTNLIPVVSFFSGAGGLDIGFEYAGFNHLASFENNGLFCDTLRKNRPNWSVIGPPNHEGDLKNREKIETILRKKIGLNTPFEGVFHGGPPCQSFSIAANQRFAKWGDNFKRIGYSHEDYGTLLFDYIWYVSIFKPKVFLVENVPGLVSVDGGKQLSEALSVLSDVGYQIATPNILNAADYGIPQHRQRVLICGWRGKRMFSFPRPFGAPPCHKAFGKLVNGASNHITRKHKASSILRYMELKSGERDHLGRVDRLNPNAPSKTVIAGGTKGGGRSHLHPHIPRTLSARESARLQTFPDDYEFCGPSARQFTQIGNAVPPLLAMFIARSIHDSLYK